MSYINILLIVMIFNLALIFFYLKTPKVSSFQALSSPRTDARQWFLFPFFQKGSKRKLHSYNKQRLLEGKQGPVVGFHQSFKPFIPELGWRDFYLRVNARSHHNVMSGNNMDNVKDNGLSNVITMNYLNKMPSVNNVYKYTDY